MLAGIQVAGPMECVVSDMTTFYVEGTYYELTLYMDLWNDELIAHALSAKRGDRMTYLNGLQDVIDFKKQYSDQKLVLHFIAIKAPYMLPRATMSFCPCITSPDPCPEPVRRRTILPWNPSMDG